MIDPSLLEILACPHDLAPLEARTVDQVGEAGTGPRPAAVPSEGEGRLEGYLVCTRCGRRYPVREGIPYLRPDDGILP